ncbi:MAG TPA: RDD family protein [Candidatus Binatia bacterium]
MEAVRTEPAELRALIEREYGRLYERLCKDEEAQAARWGGFFRRFLAFSVDIAVLCLFSLLLVYLAKVGYAVGMAAHGSSIAWSRAEGLVLAVAVAWLVLVCAYFVLLHALDGRTVGKWLFGLRVVNAHSEPITFGQAFVRWLAALLTAPLVLGFLRILWHREKRGWHDSLARTWVIKE